MGPIAAAISRTAMAAHIRNWQTVEFCQRGTMLERLIDTRVAIWYKVTRKPVPVIICRDPEFIFYSKIEFIRDD